VDGIQVVAVLLATTAAFAVSASAGFGGSLIMVPTLALLLGTRSGVALAALLLAANNVVKVWAYRKTLPLRASAIVVILVALGVALGAVLFVMAPEKAVTIGVIVVFSLSFIVERFDLTRLRRVAAPMLAFGSGAMSGFSGTSGPLKGLAVRGLNFDRLHMVGALSLASLVGDLTKTAIWTEAALLSTEDYLLALAATPSMLAATLLGRHLNSVVGERGYTGLFWAVMGGYTARLVIGL
jgi:uncharacterized membrane protein YfcA